MLSKLRPPISSRSVLYSLSILENYFCRNFAKIKECSRHNNILFKFHISY